MNALDATWIVLKRSLYWALAIGAAIGIIGGGLAISQGVEMKVVLIFPVGGVYLGWLFGIGQGIKALYGLDGFDEQPAGADAPRPLVPGLGVLSLAVTTVSLFATLFKADFKSADPLRARRATLEAVAWSIFPLGIVLLAFALSLNPWFFVGLLTVPVVALFGALSAADSSGQATRIEKE